MNTTFRQWILSALTAGVMVLIGPAHSQEGAQSQAATEQPPERAEQSTDTAPAVERRHEGSRDYDGGNAVVHIGSDSHLGESDSADAVVSVGGSSTSEGVVTDSVVAIMGNARATGRVGDSVVAVMGNSYVNSKIGGDVVAVFGDVELGPQAEVSGDVVSVGGMITRDPAAIIHGTRSTTTRRLALRPITVAEAEREAEAIPA